MFLAPTPPPWCSKLHEALPRGALQAIERAQVLRAGALRKPPPPPPAADSAAGSVGACDDDSACASGTSPSAEWAQVWLLQQELRRYGAGQAASALPPPGAAKVLVEDEIGCGAPPAGTTTALLALLCLYLGVLIFDAATGGPLHKASGGRADRGGQRQGKGNGQAGNSRAAAAAAAAAT